MLRWMMMLRHLTLAALWLAWSSNAVELQSQASILPPGTLELQSERYFTSFSNSTTGMPALGLGIGFPVLRTGGWLFTAQFGAGYRYKEGSYSVRSSEVRAFEPVTLHWVPLSAAAKITYDIVGFDFVRPTLTLGVGAQWLRLVGKLPGLTQSFWTPHLFLSPALTVWEAKTEEDWFGGFSFGPTFYQSFASPQKISGLSFDLTVNILL